MKTIKSILREILGKVEKPDGEDKAAELPASERENETETLTPNKTAYETTDEEDCGDSELVGAYGGQIGEEREEKFQGDPGIDIETGDGEREGCGGRTDTGEPENGGETISPDDPELKKAIEEAYRKGVIEGRNAQIEEKYFPMTDDGIPRLRSGRPLKKRSSDNIFALAREA